MRMGRFWNGNMMAPGKSGRNAIGTEVLARVSHSDTGQNQILLKKAEGEQEFQSYQNGMDTVVNVSNEECDNECAMGVSVSNKFDALFNEIEEGEVTDHPCKDQHQTLAISVEVPEDVEIVVPRNNSLMKVKLAKELKSLGPLEPEYRKKRKEMKGSFQGGDAMGIAGGIVVLWNMKIISFVVERSASQMVVGSVHARSLGVWKVATVYGSRCHNERRSLWRQRVNVNKSQIIFGKIVKRSCRNKEARILGFKVDLLSHVTDRLNVWGKKSLSLGGKITLIKTSLLSLPSFAITHSLVPKRVIQEFGNNVLNENCFNCSSNVWKILKDGGKYLKPIVRWRVGRGDKIQVLNDVWLLDRCLNEWPTFIDCGALENLKVQQLISDTGKWDEGKLLNLSLIRIVKLDVQWEDQLETVCKFLGKSISALAYDKVMKGRGVSDDDGFYSWLKSLKLNYNVEIFWWRLSKFAIPTNHFLKFRRLATDDHSVVNKIHEWGFFIPSFRSLEGYFEELKRISGHNSGMARIYCVDVFLNWKNRNLVKHGKVAMPCSSVAANVLSLAVLKSSPYLVSWGANLPREFFSTWRPPPLYWIKINVVASLLSSNRGGIRGIFRDHKGRLLLVFGRNKIHWDIAQLEMEVIVDIREFIQSWMLESKALGHLIAYVLKSKYQLQYPAPPDLQPPVYSNNFFNALHSTHIHPRDGEARGDEEEEEAPAPIPAPVPLHQHSQLDHLVKRFDQLETRFDMFVAHQYIHAILALNGPCLSNAPWISNPPKFVGKHRVVQAM
ncbi:hypothetical protein KFK09_014179 [Dendrobium nobile]|uniref:Uncharacterized protein n=1 Tax=Dendrobium nobile TaxID=94219 RepID=A0A8T3BAZ3_DENNO|nr:hypothetical protein KFK09_014179 [Dendrobium nobile]